MAFDAENLRWCVSGYFAAMAVFTGVAYHDPEFFLSWIFKKLTLGALLIYTIVVSFWLGAKAVKDYVANKLTISNEQLKSLLSSYRSMTHVMQWLIIAAVVTFFWGIILHSLSVARQRHNSR